MINVVLAMETAAHDAGTSSGGSVPLNHLHTAVQGGALTVKSAKAGDCLPDYPSAGTTELPDNDPMNMILT